MTFSWTIFAVTIALVLLFVTAYYALRAGPGPEEGPDEDDTRA